MLGNTLNKHISAQFNEELNSIRSHVLNMGGLVEEQLNDALKAMMDADVELARNVSKNDYRVNAFEVQIDEECTQIIAKRQPAASDLRLVVAIAKTIADLERIGDEAERIAKVALDRFPRDNKERMINLEHLGHHVRKMLHNALDAFARMDVDSAYDVHKEDQKVDRQYEALTRELMTYMMEDPRSIPQIMEVLWAARSLERIGDRCQNICEYIIYFVKGRDVRHISREEIERDVLGRER